MHSYQYSLQRVVAALVTHDPDPSRSPLRRAGMTAMVSLLIAALAVGAAAIYGLLTGHTNVNPTDPNVVFQEKGSGARYVYLDSDDKLHPVLNYTSGLLLAGSEAPQLKSISADKLAGVPLGPPLGIPDAPDSLPRKNALLTERWSVCTDNQADDGAPRATLLVGEKITDGTVAATAGKALLVREPSGQTSLVFNNRRFVIPADRLVASLRALGWADQQPWAVSVAWANAVPRGPDLAAPGIPDLGDESDAAEFAVGQLVVDNGGQYYVVLRDGVAALTDMQAKLMQAAGAGRVEEIGAEFVQIPESKTRVSDANSADGLPADIPALTEGTPARVCMTLPVDPKTGDGIRINPTVPAGALVTAERETPNSVLADYVHVARGRGVLAVSAASPSAPVSTGTATVVTDTGLGYPLANRTLITKLGYGGVKPRQIPAELMTLLPKGPSLDPQRARTALQ
ncbi:type VII secretion protein EccB [Paractinoplanes rishiriensis]|uniref:Type VII secretion protein EccB n=1 Tax=Paractinoplanes rishiriensis TaxID=1050105 RepID=A0A919K0G2_9ACTN|nr:type VII secretion protein EccB [Actinoplanes rishiriensis]